MEYRIISVYDTETTNFQDSATGDWHAFPVLFQVNTLRDPIESYEMGKSDDIAFFRDPLGMLMYIRRLIAVGELEDIVPVLCGYNALFDLESIKMQLFNDYTVDVCAQTTSNIYYMDLYDKKHTIEEIRTAKGKKRPKPLLRIWDTFHLEMRGVAAMGETAGIPKLKGDWDYNLVRAPQTELTGEEKGYAARDVQVIPAYLRYLCDSNDWLTGDMLGSRVLTKTSLVRRMAENDIGKLSINRLNGNGSYTVMKSFLSACKADMPTSYEQYALRKACFRGGFTFTSARYASIVMRNVASLDVTSMHHTFINGRKIPVNFTPADPDVLQCAMEMTVNTPIENVLNRYDKPFLVGFNARIKFTNIRLRANTPFSEEGIALALQSKFGTRYKSKLRGDAQWAAEKAVKLSGWRDRAIDGVFAFGKLYAAEECVMHLTECELYAMSLVYEWDSMQAIFGEATLKWSNPPLYVELQSHLLYRRKEAMKHIVNNYKGSPYTKDIPDVIPAPVVQGLKAGSLSVGFVKSYYQSTIKGMFNGIYGTMAQDMWKPQYVIENGAIHVDKSTVANPDNFKRLSPKNPKVLYSYGARIVGGSRLHLVLAIILLYRALGGRVHVTGGDTDSLKVACDQDVTDDDLRQALDPIAKASRAGIDRASERARRLFPTIASTLDGVGSFDIESCDSQGRTRYDYHMEAWNKTRVSIDYDGCVHVTAAGLPRPEGMYTFENAIADFCKSDTPEHVLPTVLGYNVFIYPALAFELQRAQQTPGSVFDYDVTDYKGDTYHVKTPEAIALYSVGRWLGSLGEAGNAANVEFLRDTYGRDVNTRLRYIGVRDVHEEGGRLVGTPFINYDDFDEEEED